MADIKVGVRVEFKVNLDLTENEARALDAFAGYGAKAFLERFRETLGQHYVRDLDKDVEALFAAVNSQIRPALGQIDTVRMDLNNSIKARAGKS